jgi:hypothetical protein
LSIGPAFEHLLAEPPHLLNHPPLRLVGFAQLIPSLFDQVNQTLDPPAQLRMAVEPGHQALVVSGQQSAHTQSLRYWMVTAVF